MFLLNFWPENCIYSVVNIKDMKRLVSLFATTVLISVTSLAQEITFPVLEGFRKQTNYPVYVPDNLWDFINGAADNYLAYDFVDLHVAEYKKGRQVIKIEIYRHRNNTNAFGIYSSERSPSFRFVNLGAQGYITDGVINYFTGDYYVKLRTFSGKPKVHRAMETLARRTAAMLGGETEMPVTLALFPDEGKKINQEAYINKSVLGHTFLNNAFRADYEAGPDRFSIYVFEHESDELCRETAEKYLAVTGIDQVETGERKYLVKDGYNGQIFVAWQDRRMVVVSGLSFDQADIADKYISQIL